jgi:type VI secretion system protein ImpH
MGHEADPLAWFEELAKRPFEADFYATMRRLECVFAHLPRWSEALRPVDEPVRLGQDPSLAFAVASLSSFVPGDERHPPRLQVDCFGLLGPNGPLPLHLTEFMRDRQLHEGDRTLPRFLDMLQHRFIALFYRAWAQAQPALSLDRPADDRFAGHLGSLIGLGSRRLRDGDAVRDAAKLFHSGWLVRQARNAEGLTAVLRSYFRLPVQVEQWVGRWMGLPDSERTRLGAGAGTVLGRGTVLGERVWDRQHHVRIHIGPLSLRDYERFLPAGDALPKLVAWLRNYLSFELGWDVRLRLRSTEVPRTELGSYGRLGWTTWIGQYRSSADATDLVLDAERVARANSPRRMAVQGA